MPRLPRISRRASAEAAAPATTEFVAAPAPAPIADAAAPTAEAPQPAPGPTTDPAAPDPAALPLEAPPPAADASPPAEAQPQVADAVPAQENVLHRGRLRRRLRYLRRARELAFRDLGGLIFDLHRFGRSREDLVLAKLERLAAIDVELRALEHALNDRQDIMVLREPGVAACPRCGSLHGSDANFCPNCALPVQAKANLPLAAGPQAPPTAAPPVAVEPPG